MTPNHRSGSSDESPATSDRPSSFISASRRMSTIATNLLATGLVLILGLVFGRCVIESMWANTPDPINANASIVGPEGFGNDALLHVLEFADKDSSLYCQSIEGDYDTVTSALRRRTIEMTKKVKNPHAKTFPGETKWLARIGDLKPSAAEQGEWMVFEKDGPVPVAVGVRQLRNGAQVEHSQNVASDDRRVVCWSIAIPSIAKDEIDGGPDRWALFTFVPEGDSGKSTEDDSSFPLPKQIHRTMALRADRGASMIGFKGTTRPSELMRAFNKLATQRGWAMQGDWRSNNETWTTLYIRDDKSTIQVTFVRQTNDSIRGLVILVPPVTNSEEHKK